MKKFLTFLLLGFSVLGFSQATDSLSCQKFHYNEKTIIYQIYEFGHLRHKMVIDTSTKLIQEEYFYFDDHTYKYLKFYENGRLSFSQNFQNDSLHGKSYGWHRNGVLNTDLNYYKGRLCDTSRYYYDNGNKSNFLYRKKTSLYKDTLWYYDGQLAQVCSYKNGFLHNIVSYSPSGKLLESGTFKDGNGTLHYHSILDSISYKLYIAQFKNGVKDGVEYGFSRKGDTISILHYENGILSGKAQYFKNGKLESKGQFKNGLRQGDFDYYDANNRILCKKIFEKDTIINIIYPDRLTVAIQMKIITEFIKSLKSSQTVDSVVPKYFLPNKANQIYGFYQEYIRILLDSLKTLPDFKIYQYSKIAPKDKTIFQMTDGVQDFYYPDYYRDREIFVIKHANKNLYILMYGEKIESIFPRRGGNLIHGWIPD